MTARCTACGTEIIFGTLATAEERAVPICTGCSQRAPASGFWDTGSHDVILGLDEVGWGAIAGPLMVGAVVTQKGWWWPGLRDSKKLTEPARRRLVEQLDGKLPVHIEILHVREFERFASPEHGLLETHRRAAVRMLQHFPNALVVIDGNRPIPGVPCTPVVDADALVPAVMAASVFAKVRRDRFMRGLHRVFPAYNFATNVGYGQEAIELMKKHGPSTPHRRHYNPLKEMLGGDRPRRRMEQLRLPFGGT